MKYFKISFLLTLCLASFNLFACANFYETKEEKFIKVYVTEKDLLLHDNQILFNVSGELESLNAVYCDADGLYIVIDQKTARRRNRGDFEAAGNTCFNGHPEYHKRQDWGCGGCAHWGCPFRCKCHSPWNN